MKITLLIISFSLFTTILSGQVNVRNTTLTPVELNPTPVENSSWKERPKTQIEDTLRVLCTFMHKTENAPAYYVNGAFVGDFIQWVNTEEIAQVYVERQKENSVLYNKEYPGKVYFTLKDSLVLDLQTLDEIRNRYIKFETNHCMYMINHDLFTGNASTCKIDKNHILSIEVEKVKTIDSHSGQPVEVSVIEIKTKTKENIEKTKHIILRGKE